MEELWLLKITLPQGCPDRYRVKLEGLADGIGMAVSSYENDQKQWVVEILSNDRLESKIPIFKEYLDTNAIDQYHIESEPLPEKDWVKESEEILAPFTIGRFFVYGSFYRGKIPVKFLPLRIDAGLAFGTGRHETTAGCLKMMQIFRNKRKYKFQKILDLGCGSGILAMGAARLWNDAYVLAVDLDYEALDVTRENLKVNNLAGKINVRWSNGYGSWVKKRGPFDLVVANILARPISKMSYGLAKNLAPQGFAILSGLLTSQEDFVERSHNRHNLVVVERLRMGEWSILVVRHGSRPSQEIIVDQSEMPVDNKRDVEKDADMLIDAFKYINKINQDE